MIWDLNCQIKSSEESKVSHFEEKSEDLKEQRIELDKGSDLAKCKHKIDIFILIEKVEYLLILFKSYSFSSNLYDFRFKTKSWIHWIRG